MSNATQWENPDHVLYGFDPPLCCAMLNATKQDQRTDKPNGNGTHGELENGFLVREPNAETTFIEVQHYLDFKYGSNRVDIILPDKSRANLVVGVDGRAYFEVPVSD